MEVYIDDMLVKSKKAEDHVGHLKQSFDVLRQYGMKLNPTKCSFGVSAGKFLGYIMTQRGIEASPDQIKAIINIQSPRNIKEVQKLTGRVAALNRFISKSFDKCCPFYDVLWKNNDVLWTEKHEKALQDLKKYMASPPLLSKAKEHETLQLYLVVSATSVSAVLAREDDHQQLHVYYVSLWQRCLVGNEQQEVLQEKHDGECDNHSGGRSLAKKVLRLGYFWPTLKKDAETYVAKCDSCQRFTGLMHKPPEMLHPTLCPWPFMKWGMDIVGKLPVAPGQKVFMLALTNYFSKWIEVDSFTQVRDKEVTSFIWNNIICRFDIPSEIVCDNGSQFISDKTRRFCDKWNIKLCTSTPRYPQANG
ncbi:uncharacterized protein K02A2.6-like [Chenopodium quinoa]|uniref:uncharacterized protein K02A2.6-like n=1 Tax=Chenopodium quinoa TaxID=63459 RepID=UPI000B79A05E|nr:uncharacterized protein K02A2.6-like [Chenopodium quinoa]